jgi:hypothetical protein
LTEVGPESQSEVLPERATKLNDTNRDNWTKNKGILVEALQRAMGIEPTNHPDYERGVVADAQVEEDVNQDLVSFHERFSKRPSA